MGTAKTYKCKTCQAEFQDLSKYRAHILTHRQEPTTAEEPQEKSQAIKPKIPLEEARRKNSCRGEFEGKYKEICCRYNRCEDCWAHYGE